MGNHDQFFRRNKHNRIANDEEEKLKQLIARYSPTAIYTETLTMTSTPSDFPTLSPQDTTPDPTPTPTLTPSPNTPTNLPTDTPATTAAPDTNTVATNDPNTAVTNAVGPDTSVAPDPVDTATLTTASLPSLSLPSYTVSVPTSASITSSAASATATSEGSGTNVGGVVGGIAGALLGLAVLGFGIRFIMKRRNRPEITPFDAHDFRRSALMLGSEGPHSGGDPNGGYPEMAQQRNIGAASPAPTFGTLYGRPGPAQARDLANINTNWDNDHYGAMGAPHPYSSPYGQYSPPETANSAHPMYPNGAYNADAGAPYGQNPFSPAPSHASYNGSAPGTPSTLVPGAGAGIAGAAGFGGAIAGVGILTRQNSSATHLSNPQYNAPKPHQANGHLDDGGYVDLDRNSVTPFQQAQYAEISERLGTPVPNGLTTPAVAALAAKNERELPAPPVETHNDGPSPFADPVAGSPRSITPPTAPAQNIPASLAPSAGGPRGSAISSASATSEAPRPSTDTTDITNDFPAPPSPALPSPAFMSSTASFKSRVDSTPPTLPEIFIGSSSASGVNTPQRIVSYDFPMSVRGSDLGHSDIGHSSEGHGAVLTVNGSNSTLGTPVNTGYPSSIFGAYAGQGGYPSGMSAATQAAPGMGQEVLVHPSLSSFKFPATPSPLASSFGVITPEVGRSTRGFAADQEKPPVVATASGSQLSHEIKPHEEVMAVEKATPAAEEKKNRPNTVYDDDDAYGGI